MTPEEFLQEYVPDDCREEASKELKKILEAQNVD